MLKKILYGVFTAFVVAVISVGIINAMDVHIKGTPQEIRELTSSEDVFGFSAPATQPYVLETPSSTLQAATTTRFLGDITPKTTDTYHFGAAEYAWKDAFISGTLNVSSTISSGDLLPDIANLRNFGSFTLPFKDIYASGTIYGDLSGAITPPATATTTFTWGVLMATTGGNVGIGTASPAEMLEVNGSIRIAQGSFLKSGANTLFGGNGFNTLVRPDSSGGEIQFQSFAGGTNATLLDSGKFGINTASPSHLLTLFDSTAANHPLFAVGDGSSTTTLSGGTAGNATSTFAGDVVIDDIYIGKLELPLDNGISGVINASVSSGAATGTPQGYDFEVDSIGVARIDGRSDAQGLVWDTRFGLYDNTGNASTTMWSPRNDATSTPLMDIKESALGGQGSCIPLTASTGGTLYVSVANIAGTESLVVSSSTCMASDITETR